MKSPFRPNHVLRQLRLSLEEDDEGPSPEPRRSCDPFCFAVTPPSASTTSTDMTEKSSSSSSSSPPFSSGEGPILRLRFLRTFVVDCTALMHLRLDASMARWHARQDATPGTTSSTASSSQEGRRSSVLEHAQRLFELQRRSVGSPDVVEHVALRRVPTEAIPQLEESLFPRCIGCDPLTFGIHTTKASGTTFSGRLQCYSMLRRCSRCVSRCGV